MRHVLYLWDLVLWKVEYALRPYDMLADRRRWFWQRPQRCGFSLRLMLPDPTPEDNDAA